MSADPDILPPEHGAGVINDAWQDWRRHTSARIALGRAGHAQPTSATLAFSLAHAQARDAIHTPLDAARLQAELEADGWAVQRVHSQVENRHQYLLRPDLGRRLHEADAVKLRALASKTVDISLTIGDGLSSTAVQRHALPLLHELREQLGGELTLGPLVLAEQARVALADVVGEALRARIAVILLGERPGLSSPDSLGIYLTHSPRVGRHDAERNCISNVRPEGLGYKAAAFKLAWLLRQSLHRGLSGVALKDESDLALPSVTGALE